MKNSPETNFFKPIIEKAKAGLKNQLPFFVKRHWAEQDLKEKGFKKFDDFRILDISVDEVSKINHPFFPGGKEIKDQEIFGTILMESPLLADEAVLMKWKAFVQVSMPRRENMAPSYSVFYGWKNASDSEGADYNWINRDPSVPEQVCQRGKDLGLDDYGVYAKGFYEFGKNADGTDNNGDTPFKFTEPFVKYYESLKWRVMQKMKEYLRKYTLPELSIKEKNRESFYRIDMDASAKTEEELDREQAEAFKSGRVDSKYIYLLGGAEQFIHTTKTEEYALYDTEKNMIKENKKELAEATNPVIYDLGCGDGQKARILLEEKLKKKEKAIYHPVDITPRMVIEACVAAPERSLPEGMLIDFTKDFKDKIKKDGQAHSFLLLGNTLGNGSFTYQADLLKNICASMDETDNLLVGVQMNYDFEEILKMYQTPESIEFARPMLRELGLGDDDVEIFVTGDAERKEISLNIKLLTDVSLKIGKPSINLGQGFVVRLITSQKYDVADIDELATEAGLEIKKSFINQDNSYSLIIFEKKKVDLETKST